MYGRQDKRSGRRSSSSSSSSSSVGKKALRKEKKKAKRTKKARETICALDPDYARWSPQKSQADKEAERRAEGAALAEAMKESLDAVVRSSLHASGANSGETVQVATQGSQNIVLPLAGQGFGGFGGGGPGNAAAHAQPPWHPYGNPPGNTFLWSAINVGEKMPLSSTST